MSLELARDMPSHSTPPSDELNNTRRFCCAIICYMEEEEDHISSTVQTMTEEVLPQIMALADQGSDDKEMGMSIDEYNDVLHLCFIPNIVDVVEPYLGLPAPLVPSLLNRIVTILGQIFHLTRSSHRHRTPLRTSPHRRYTQSDHRHPDPRYLSNLLPRFITSSIRRRLVGNLRRNRLLI